MTPLPARALELTARLDLEPHVEGGRFRRIHTAAMTRAEPDGAARPVASAIHYLLAAGEFSRWHRVDADEFWCFAEGSALELWMFDPAQGEPVRHRLGQPDDGAMPLLVVPAGCWQAARPLGDYTLASCVVAPEFRFAGFALLDAAPEVRARLAAFGEHWPDLA